VRDHELSQCKSDTDCSLRMGLACCEACDGGSGDVVAINRDQGELLRQLACGNELIGCPKCAPLYPDGAEAVCTAGQCEVVFAGESG
jgi:hypothetical protein